MVPLVGTAPCMVNSGAWDATDIQPGLRACVSHALGAPAHQTVTLCVKVPVAAGAPQVMIILCPKRSWGRAKGPGLDQDKCPFKAQGSWEPQPM